MSRQKLFPLRLPSNYHGALRPFESNTQKYFKKAVQRQQVDQSLKRISKWQRKISDLDVLCERSQYLLHPAKISSDTPDWLKSTYHYYSKSVCKPFHKEGKEDAKKFDVFGQKKHDPIPSPTQLTQPTLPNRKQPISKQITSKIGAQYSNLLCLRKSKMEVSDKIGLLETRTEVVRRPQLKVGSLHENNFVDTYTVN